MKKRVSDTTFLDVNNTANIDLDTSKFKTTNINILLNRVKLDNKRELKKKIFFLVLLISVISLTVFFALN